MHTKASQLRLVYVLGQDLQQDFVSDRASRLHYPPPHLESSNGVMLLW